jgi:hypothetical protein
MVEDPKNRRDDRQAHLLPVRVSAPDVRRDLANRTQPCSLHNTPHFMGFGEKPAPDAIYAYAHGTALSRSAA